MILRSCYLAMISFVLSSMAFELLAQSPGSKFIRQDGNKLVVGDNNQILHLRGVNFAGYFMIAANGDWYTEGAERPHPSPDADKPVVFDETWQNWFTEKHFAFVAQTGFNVIRVPLTYRIFEDNGNPGQYKQEGWDFLDKYITWAKKYNVYLILDMHIPQGGCQPCGGGAMLWRNTGLQTRFRDLWKEIARRYTNETIIAGYDLLNEPHPTSSATDSQGDNIQWKTLAQQVSDDIRTVDKNHLLIVEAVNWVDDGTLGDWSLDVLAGFQFLVDDSNVMYDIHFYFPFDYVFTDNPSSYPSTVKVPAIDGRRMAFDRNYLKTEIETIMNFSTTNSVPINFGEWSGPAFDKEGGLEYVRDLVSLCDQNGVNWNFWSLLDFYRTDEMRDKDLLAERIAIFAEYFKTDLGEAPSPPKNVRVSVD